jgi:polysaccharide biosynthesis/export protein
MIGRGSSARMFDFINRKVIEMSSKIVSLTLTAAALLVAVSAYAQSGARGVAVQDAPAVKPVTASVETQGTPFNQRYQRYKLEPGDILDISFTFSPEYNQSLTVQPDGFITLSEVGDLHVQGLSTHELVDSVKKAYAGILHDPVVTVVLKDFAKPFFVVGGEVKNPGKFELRGGTTLTQAIAVAGGFTEASKHSQVWLYRRTAGEQVLAKKLNVKAMQAKGDLSEDFAIQPGDTIFVPQNTLSKIKGTFMPRPVVGATTAIRP